MICYKNVTLSCSYRCGEVDKLSLDGVERGIWGEAAGEGMAIDFVIMFFSPPSAVTAMTPYTRGWWSSSFDITVYNL